MEITPLMLALYGSAALGLLIGLYRAYKTFGNQINIDLFAKMVCKLIDAGNLERALKLCAAAPKALFVEIVRPALQMAGEEKTGDAQRRARRFEQVAEKSYERVLAADKLSPMLSYTAIFLGCLPLLLVVALKGTITPPIAVMGALAAALGLFSANASRKLRQQARPAIERIGAALRKQT